MVVLHDLELVEVAYENENKKAVLTFLDVENGEIREVNFNRQSYVNGKYVDDPEKGQKVDEWCDTYFGTSFDKLGSCVGCKKDIYCYERFSSMFEVQTIEKFTKEMNKKIFQTQIKEVIVDEFAIRIRYDIKDKTYESKMVFGKYLETMKKWFLDPMKKQVIFKKFEEKYHCNVENASSLIGTKIMVECKCAFGTSYYGDIKDLPEE